MNINELDTFRGSRAYFIESIFIKDEDFERGIKISLSHISLDTLRKTSGRPVVYTFSLDNYMLNHKTITVAGNPVPWDENKREVLFLQSDELMPHSRYITMLTSNLGTGMSGTSSFTIESRLPENVTFKIGFMKLSNLEDFKIYNPNVAIPELAFANQQLEYVVVRFRITAHFV